MSYQDRAFTANGKVFVVFDPTAYRTLDGRAIVGYPYRGTRNGEGTETFGPIRLATTADGPKTVGAQLVAQARERFNVDHEAMISRVQANKDAGEVHKIEREQTGAP